MVWAATPPPGPAAGPGPRGGGGGHHGAGGHFPPDPADGPSPAISRIASKYKKIPNSTNLYFFTLLYTWGNFLGVMHSARCPVTGYNSKVVI